MSAAFIPKPLSEKKVLSNKACSRILLNIANATAQADWPRDIGTPGELELVFSRPPAVGDPVAGPSAIPYTVADSATLRKASNTGSKKRKLGVRDKENVAEEKPRKRYKEGFPAATCDTAAQTNCGGTGTYQPPQSAGPVSWRNTRNARELNKFQRKLTGFRCDVKFKIRHSRGALHIINQPGHPARIYRRPQVRMEDTFQSNRIFLAGALVEKGLSDPSLLSTYSEERVPVIIDMLKITSELFRNVATATKDETGLSRAILALRTRDDHVKQFGVNYRWSSIVLDERTPVDEGEDIRANAYGSQKGDVLRAGDRAPDALDLSTARGRPILFCASLALRITLWLSPP
ncbi:predicted protein [Postia placenta Mad-698-R]|nr:predicted protein [Postia placenta Mad-698-R]